MCKEFLSLIEREKQRAVLFNEMKASLKIIVALYDNF